MAQLMAALRGQFRQPTTRGWAVSGHRRRLHFVTGNHSMFTGESNELQRSVVRQTAKNYRKERLFCTEAVLATGLQQARHRFWDLRQVTAAGMVLVAAVGVLVDLIMRRAETRSKELQLNLLAKRNQLAHVNDQLAKLYGPLYGNRLAMRKTYGKVLSKNIKTRKKYDNLQTYLEDARLEWQKKGWFERWWDDPSAVNRGRSMLTRWRRFLLYIIHPLDLQAEEIVRANAHLIDNSEKNAELFRKFVFHVNYQTFIVAKWEDRLFVVGSRKNYVDGDFDLWSNSGILEEDTADFNQMLEDLENHVNETYMKLVKRQKQLMEGLEILEEEKKDETESHEKTNNINSKGD